MARNKNKRRCSAVTRSRRDGRAGQPCRAWARRESDPPRCTFHGRGALPDATARAEGRACTAANRDGARCRNWAMHGSERCSVHAGLIAPRESHRTQGPRASRRACSARLPNGDPCPAWALRDSCDPPLCSMHAGLGTPDRSHACSATRRDGTPCRGWAIPGTARQVGRPLCRAHLPPGDPRRLQQPLPGPADRARGRVCTATTVAGKPCRNWALRDSCSSAEAELPSPTKFGRAPSGRPLCWVHAFPHQHPLIRHGYYRRLPHFSRAEHAAIVRLARDGQPLDAELLTLRLKLRDAFLYLRRLRLTGPQKERTARVIFRGALAVSRLLRAQKELIKLDWRPQSAGGAGQLLQNILDNEDTRPDRFLRPVRSPSRKHNAPRETS